MTTPAGAFTSGDVEVEACYFHTNNETAAQTECQALETILQLSGEASWEPTA